MCYHAINRGNGRSKVFHADGDFALFVELLDCANLRVDMRLRAFCLMPNHFHLVLWPRHDGDLSRDLQGLLTAHVRQHHRRRGSRSSGHVWQGRYKAFPIEQDVHLLTVMRYVERNALRAGLVKRAEQWPWSSAADRPRFPETLLCEGPVPRPRDWRRRLNTPPTAVEDARVRRGVIRGTPPASIASASRSLAMICSGPCRFRFIPPIKSPPRPSPGLKDSQNSWIRVWGAGRLWRFPASRPTASSASTARVSMWSSGSRSVCRVKVSRDMRSWPERVAGLSA